MTALLLGSWPVPLERLSCDGSNAFEVPVAMQQYEFLEFGCGGHYQINRPGAAVPIALGQHVLHVPGPVVGAVIDGYPSEQAPHILDDLVAVSGGASAEEELEIGYGATSQ